MGSITPFTTNRGRRLYKEIEHTPLRLNMEPENEKADCFGRKQHMEPENDVSFSKSLIFQVPCSISGE